jgi:hypothetical protein
MPDNEETPPEPTLDEDTPPQPVDELALLNERVTSLETALSECRAQLQAIETDYTRGDHTHDGYSPNEHEHGYALSEHNHETITSQEDDKHPEPAHFWYRKFGE